jgi:isopenicillin-N N-acyltransferase-like protein
VSARKIQRIVVSGDAYERGVSYGHQSAPKVRHSIAAYREVFQYYAGWSWTEVVECARAFEGPIRGFRDEYWTELCGIADGAGVDRQDILAINLRTEIMFAAKARQATEGRPPIPVSECTAVGISGGAREGGATILAQNWDWLAHSRETVVILEERQDDRPDFITVVEAGLLAKFGLNSVGIAVGTNALVTDLDAGEPGLPYHVLLRAMLDSQCASDALAVLQAGFRSSSANYVIADGDGLLYDIEATPGRAEGLYVDYPEEGLLGHTNHFVAPGLRCKDLSLSVAPDSPLRLVRYRSWASAKPGADGLYAVRRLLTDHANFPSSICRHEDGRLPPLEQYVTVVSAVMAPASRQLWLAPGNPCTEQFVEIDCASLKFEKSVGVSLVFQN